MALATFVDQVVTRLRGTAVDLDAFPSGTVPGSLFSGAAGVAFFLLEMARLRRQDDLLPLARAWLDVANRWALRALPSDWIESPFGFLMGASGPAYVGALLSAREGDERGVLAAVERMNDAAGSLAARGTTEYMGGLAGLLGAAGDLAAQLPSGQAYQPATETLARIRDAARDRLLMKYEAPLAPAPHDPIGIAHGIAGELLALVRVLGAAHDVVRPRLEELAALREEDEQGYVYWLPSLNADAPNLLGSWCNGTAGHALLWCEVARQTKSAEATELARQCVESTTLLRNGSLTVCCGLAGDAIALQRYADLVGDARVGRHAYRRLTTAVAHAGDGQDAFAGLWQGVLGIAWVAAGRLAGETTSPGGLVGVGRGEVAS